MNASRATLSRFAIVGFVAPIALALAACDSTEDGDGGSLDGDPIADIPAPEGTAWTETVTVTDEMGYKVGNPEAPLKLIEYASHTCPACAAFATTGKVPLKKYIESGVVSFEQREVFLNTFDVVIAALVTCGAKERMQPLSDEIWTNLNQLRDGFSRDPAAIEAAAKLPLDQRFVRLGEVTGLVDFVAARGLSADEAKTCLADGEKIENMVKKTGEVAQADKVSGTPTFLLNGKALNENSWAKIEPILQRAGARKE